MLAYIPRYANLISDKFPPWLCMYTIIRGNSSKNRPAREQQTSLQLDWQLNNRQRYKPTGKQPNDGGTNRPATHASNSGSGNKRSERQLDQDSNDNTQCARTDSRDLA